MTDLFNFNFNDNMFIRFSSDDSESFSLLNIDNIVIEEQTRSSVPIITMRYMDYTADTLNRFYIHPSQVYTLSYGKIAKGEFDVSQTQFTLSHNKMENAKAGSPNSLMTTISFLQKEWPSYLNTHYSRSWSDVRYSSVVSEIAEESNFTSDVEQTEGFYNVIQPDWSNFKLIKWLAKQAVNTNGLGGYEYGVTMDSRLIFKTYDSLSNSVPKKSFVMRETEDENNEFRHFKGFSLRQDYTTGLAQKYGFGLNYIYFDYDTKEFIDGTKKVSDSSQRQLSDYYFISQDHETATRRFNGGRHTDTPDLAQSMVLQGANQFQIIGISITGDLDLHIGDIVDLIIPSPLERRNDVVDIYYSGRWMIRRVAHVFNRTHGKFISNLILSRPGINDTVDNGLVSTTIGRKLTK